VSFDEFDVLTAREPEGIATIWLRGLDADKKKEVVELLLRSTVQFDLLRNALEELYRAAQQVEDDITSPNWHLVAARQAGYKKALRDIHKLLPRPKERKE
jgi:hypothetical protein